MRQLWLLLIVFVLAGCLSGEANMRQGGNAGEVSVGRTPAASSASPAATADDVRRITHEETQASSNAINQNMGGMVDLAMGKAAEKIVGAQAADVSALKVQLENQVKVTAKLADELKVTNTANLELKGKLELQNQIVNDMKLQLGSMSNQIQAGFNNKTENTSVGRDFVNMLPKTAVDMIVDLAKLFAGIVTGLIGVLATLFSLIYRSIAQQARLKANAEAEERQLAHQTLIDVLATLDPAKAKELHERIASVRQKTV